MKFYIFFLLLAILVFTGCSEKNAVTQKKIKIGILNYVNSLYTEEADRGIIEGLKENSLTENCIIDNKNAQGDMSALNNAGDIFVQGDYDLIFTVTPPAMQVAAKKIKNKPVVFTNAGNPIEAGIGKSFDAHIPNITGICTITDFDAALKIIINFFPEVKRIGTLFNPSEIDSSIYHEKFKKILNDNSVELIAVPINSPSDITDAANNLCQQKIDVICQIIDNVTGAAFAGISQASQKNKIPLFCFGSQPVKKGLAFAAASRDYYDCGRDAVEIAVRILKGEKPEDIPITIAKQTKLVLNRKLAELYNIKLTSENTKIFTEIY